MRAKKVLSTILKLSVSAALIGYLTWRASNDPQFGDLLAGEKNWPVLVCALPVCLFTVTITILRWNLLIGALGLSFSVGETLRAGFLGYLANLLPFGLVAGDSLKAVMLIHRNPQHKTEAVASVVIDRVLGLYALLLLAAVASLLLPADQLDRLAAEDQSRIAGLSRIIQFSALASSAALAVMLIPAVTRSRLWDILEHALLIGPVLHKLVGAMRAYRRRIDLLLAAIGISIVIHVSYAMAFVLMMQGLVTSAEQRPSEGSIFIIVPPSMIAGALPIGTLEVVFTLFFQAVSPPSAPENVGLLIALTYRLIQICIATIGLGYWLAGRREVRALMQEAEGLQPVDGGDETPPATSAVGSG